MRSAAGDRVADRQPQDPSTQRRRRRIAPVDLAGGRSPALELGGRQRIHQRVVVSRQPRELADALDGARAQGFHEREELGADTVAQERRIVVRRIEPIRDPRGVEHVAQLSASLPEERPDHPAAPGRDPRAPVRPLPRMRFMRTVSAASSAVCAVAMSAPGPATSSKNRYRARRPASSSERRSSRAMRADIGLSELAGDAEAGRRRGDEFGVLWALGPKSVIEVRHDDSPVDRIGGRQARGAVHQRHRIGATRDRKHEVRVTGDLQGGRAPMHRIGQGVDGLPAPARALQRVRRW